MTKENFIKELNEKYNGKYECRISEDKKTIRPTDMIPVICPKHGLFLETAYNLLNDMACFECFKEEKWS